ncbi:hypothetical protein [Clostridium uliginosum]|uniref:MrpR N-terminal core-binding domain-containing protein n=1 Tax=Clostridium uliginosum TaxID=119641 RepID=A0A1I1GRV5_9CLOT|nr:hypothetical protein [Clostridium uliginosum]SFC14195.1 hypothetical protein SAMN05421842_10136 [Clostridium uliginosum]
MYDFLSKIPPTISYIKENYDKFQINKIKWLESSMEYAFITQRTYWVTYKHSIHDIEKKKNKDLYDFTNEEIEEMLNQIGKNIKTIRVLKSIIINYIEWAIENGYKLKENPDGSLDKSKLFKTFRAKLVINYKTLDEFYHMLEELKCSDIDKMMLVLGRYGIVGKQFIDMANLKWEDVDRENMFVNVGNHIKLPIDERFITYLERAHKCEIYDYQTSTLKYIDFGYVMKVSDKSEENIIKYNTLNTRAYSIYKNNGMNRIAFGDLITWRMFDLLFEILENKGEVTYKDIKNVITILKGSSTMSKAQYLKERFMIVKEYREELTRTI